MKDLINGGKGYLDHADFVIIDTKPISPEIFKKDGIIFCKTDFIDHLFNFIKFSSRKYILITHWSDYHVNKTMFDKRPPCIKKWYASATVYEHPELIQIPIGFGIFYHEFPKVNEELQNWFIDNSDRFEKIEKDYNTVYCNYSIDRFRPPRYNVMEKIMSTGVKCFMPEHQNTVNGRLTFRDYCEQQPHYKFVASPPGNGIDCHRNWEAIYMGCIPIVIRNLVYKNYDLPILQVDDYLQVNQKLLDDYIIYYNEHQFNWDQCHLSYWVNRMKTDLKSYL